jgi:hypothetical protein
VFCRQSHIANCTAINGSVTSARGRLRVEPDLLQQLVDAPVEALDHAFRLRVAPQRQPMLHAAEAQATSNLCLPLGFLLLVELVGELRAVVSQKVADLDWQSLL